jgi:UDP-glucose 4-epimerase
MNHILITGGAGFLGSHLCEFLLNNGADVLCIDNFFSGNKDNIRHLFSHPYFEISRHDIIHPFFAEVDKVYHLACPASPIHYQYNAIKTVPLLPKFMETRKSIHKQKITGAMSIPSVSAAVMMKEKELLRLLPWTIPVRTMCKSGSLVFLTPTAPVWQLTMAEL